MRVHQKSGFTLLEIIIVIIILGILASIALPKFADTLKSSREGAGNSALASICREVAAQSTLKGAFTNAFVPTTVNVASNCGKPTCAANGANGIDCTATTGDATKCKTLTYSCTWID